MKGNICKAWVWLQGRLEATNLVLKVISGLEHNLLLSEGSLWDPCTASLFHVNIYIKTCQAGKGERTKKARARMKQELLDHHGVSQPPLGQAPATVTKNFYGASQWQTSWGAGHVAGRMPSAGPFRVLIKRHDCKYCYKKHEGEGHKCKPWSLGTRDPQYVTGADFLEGIYP